MGLSSKKQKTTENTAFNNTSSATNTATTTPNVPDWLIDPAKRIAGGVGDLLGQGPGAFTPVISDLQRQAWTGAAGLKGPDFSDARGILAGMGHYDPTQIAADQIGSRDIGYDRIGANDIDFERIASGDISSRDIQGESLLTGLSNYYNPFKDQVLNPVLTDFDYQSGQTRAGQAAQAAKNKAFQGSRYGIQEAETEGQLARGRAATEGGLLKDMYSEATRLSADDAARRQAASVSNQQSSLQAALANQQAALEAARANQMAGLTAGQSNQQAALEAARANQAAGLTAGQSNQQAALDAARANQGANLTAGQSNQRAGLDAAGLNQAGDLARAEGLAGLTGAELEQQRANLGLIAGLGGDQADRLTAQNQYPIEFLKQMGGLFQGLDPRMFTGQTVTGSSTQSASGTGKSDSTTTASESLGSWFGNMLQAAAAGAGSAAMAGG